MVVEEVCDWDVWLYELAQLELLNWLEGGDGAAGLLVAGLLVARMDDVPPPPSGFSPHTLVTFSSPSWVSHVSIAPLIPPVDIPPPLPS